MRIILAMVLMFGAALPAMAQDALESASVSLPSKSLTFSTTYLAQDLGLFTRAGVNMKIVDINGVGAPNAVISGSVEFTLTTGSTFSRAAIKGQRMLIVANMIERPQMELVFRQPLADQLGFDAKSPVETRGKLLKGRTIAVDGIFTNLHAWVQLVARKAGLDPEKDLKVTPMPAPNMLAGVASGVIDGFSSSPPWTTMATQSKAGIVLASSYAGDAPEIIPFAYSVLATRPEVCEQRQSLCEKVVKAYAAAARILHDEPERATAALKARFPDIPDPVLAAAVETIRRSTPERPLVTIEGLQNSETFNVRAGVLKAEETLKSFDGLFTTRFVP